VIILVIILLLFRFLDMKNVKLFTVFSKVHRPYTVLLWHAANDALLMQTLVSN